MVDKHRVTYDSDIEDAFCVHMPHKIVKFTRNPMGLYVVEPFKRVRFQEAQFLNTVDENKQLYSDRQIDRAKKARDLYHALGTPTVKDLKAAIRMNAVANNPITTQDIDLAEKVFGPDISSLKGKTTRQKPIPVVDDHIDIPRELTDAHYHVTLCVDVMKVNTLSFLTTISRHLYYRRAQWIPSHSADHIAEALRSVCRVYHTGGFRVTDIHCDNEFRPVMRNAEFNGLPIVVNFANPDEHVPEAERNNRTIKERVRVNYHYLPYTRWTRIMVKAVVAEAAKKLTFFPAKDGISPYYSPRMLVHKKTLDYDKHCRYSFGMYVQAHDELTPSNTNAPRTLDCIYLRYTDSAQGGHDLLLKSYLTP